MQPVPKSGMMDSYRRFYGFRLHAEVPTPPTDGIHIRGTLMLKDLVAGIASRSGIRRTLGFFALNLASCAALALLLELVKTNAALAASLIPIVLSGWLFGKMGAALSALFIFCAEAVYFSLTGDGAPPTLRSMVPGILTNSVYGLIGVALRVVHDMSNQIKTLNAKLVAKNKTLQEFSFKDPLTGLHNRRYANEFVSRIASTFLKQITTPEVAARGIDLTGKVMLVMIADVDDIRSVNERHGQEAGDRALVEISKRVRESIRFDDSAMRWGGDEFLVVCPMVRKANAYQVVEKILDAVRSRPVPVDDATRSAMSVSVGAVWVPFMEGHPFAVSFDFAIELAEKALQVAKREGRNQARLVMARDDAAAMPLEHVPKSVDDFFDKSDCCHLVAIGANTPAAAHVRRDRPEPGVRFVPSLHPAR